ncbi:MAG TPA: ATP-binding protein [Ramlibacter sp.]|nr:ATP-binding protein [Ramlibacter sp.]
MSAEQPSVPARAGPLRLRLLLLAASGLVPLVLMLAWGLNYLIEDRRQQAGDAVLELSRALATAVNAELQSVIALLDNMGTSDELERADLRAFHQSARRTVQQLGWRQVVLSDGEGRILLRSSDPYGAPNRAVVEPRSMARVLATRAPAVTPVAETPHMPSDTFAVRVPVLRSGQIVYVITGVLPTDKIVAVLTRQNIPAGSVASVFDQNNRRVARSLQGASPYPTASLQELLDQGGLEGKGVTVTSEGVESDTGFTRLKDSGWVVVAGQSVALTNKGVSALLRAVALGLAASLLLSVLLAWMLSRHVVGPINALKRGAAALGRGEPVELPPLDIVELDDVAVALRAAAADRDCSASQVRDALRMAKDANRSKDQFLAMLGHELRNPLAPISTAVQLMALKGDQSTLQERRIIERQLVHVTRLVDDLLDVSRITSGRLAIRRQPVRIGQVLAQVVETIHASVFQRSLALDLAPGVEGAWVAGDEVRLVQVFNNLLVNAIKFTGVGQTIRVGAALEGPQLRVDVQDTGIGLSDVEVDRIFDLFYQAPQNSDRARGGLGLGLAIVRSLVEMHGGSVLASSPGLGQGTCLTVRLPLCEAPAAPESTPAPPESQGAGQILVVDDNEDAADTCATLLELSGYQVRVAYSPEATLELLREFTPAVAVLDIGLQGMNGYQLAAAMRATHAYGGRLVALTGYGQAADKEASQRAGFDAHLTKPVSPQTLLDLIEKLVNPDGTRQGAAEVSS